MQLDNYMVNGQYFFKQMFDLVGFTYASGLFTNNQDLVRFHYRKIPFLFFGNVQRNHLFLTHQIKTEETKHIFYMFDVR